MTNDLEQAFHEAMKTIYIRAKEEADYTATRFMQMVANKGGLETAQYLLHSSTVSEGYSSLWERNRLDLTVEALVLNPKWHSLFTAEELEIARNRLVEYGYTFQ